MLKQADTYSRTFTIRCSLVLYKRPMGCQDATLRICDIHEGRRLHRPIRSYPELSLQASSFKNKVEDEMVVASHPSLLKCHPGVNYQNQETPFQMAIFCASSDNQCSTDELVLYLEERVGVGPGELRAALKGVASGKRDPNVDDGQARWTTATDEG